MAVSVLIGFIDRRLPVVCRYQHGIISLTEGTKFILRVIGEPLDQTGKFDQVRNSKPAFAGGQCDEGVLWSQIGPAQWNLTLPALLVNETPPVFTAVFFAARASNSRPDSG